MTRVEMLELLSGWSSAGYKETPAGSVYIGRPRPELSRGYFHEIFCPIAQSARDQFGIENSLMRNFKYWEQLGEVNGAILFYQKLSLYGVHRGQVSSLDLPFDILTANIENWGTLSTKDSLVIGAYLLGDIETTLVEMNDGSVSAFDDAVRPVSRWASLDGLLHSEIESLARRYNDLAEELDEGE